jgi:hypothetical protein
METMTLERLLWSAAQYQAARLGFGFSDDSSGHVADLIRGGVQRVETEGYLEDTLRIALAESNIISFTTRMAIEARQMNLLELRESTFWAARNAICPLWPFC